MGPPVGAEVNIQRSNEESANYDDYDYLDIVSVVAISQEVDEAHNYCDA